MTDYAQSNKDRDALQRNFIQTTIDRTIGNGQGIVTVQGGMVTMPAVMLVRLLRETCDPDA